MNILYEDNHLMVIVKDAGLITVSDNPKEVTLSHILQTDYGIDTSCAGVVHRLDKDTSGLLLVAKTQQALENLQAQFKERKIKKEYWVLVHGFLEKGGVVKGAIGRNPGDRKKFTVFEGAKPGHPEGGLGAREAMTKYEPLQILQFTGDKLQEIFHDLNKIQMRKLERVSYNQFTLLICRPLTGRTHQIRVHLKYINHPIVGDEKYVGRKVYKLDQRWCPRQFLHAKKIGFYHPQSAQWMEFESKLAEDLRKILWKIFLYNWL